MVFSSSPSGLSPAHPSTINGKLTKKADLVTCLKSDLLGRLEGALQRAGSWLGAGLVVGRASYGASVRRRGQASATVQDVSMWSGTLLGKPS